MYFLVLDLVVEMLVCDCFEYNEVLGSGMWVIIFWGDLVLLSCCICWDDIDFIFILEIEELSFFFIYVL